MRFEDLPSEERAKFSEDESELLRSIDRADEMRERLRTVPKLDAAPETFAVALGADFDDGPDERTLEPAMQVLAWNAATNPGCAVDPIGFTDVKGERRCITFYWPAGEGV